ncbi:MAG TPA: RNase adapter RapZ, partial [Paracoccaceae bacterium]|nr:RNase adapter RapZ [Paracoccaceae bacterium]
MPDPLRPSAGDPAAPQRVVFVTGPSGAGRSTAIHALEDLGYEAIDNLPLSLVPRLLDGPPLSRP